MASDSHGTRKLILDLKDVIGELPTEEARTALLKPEMFHTLGNSTVDPKIEELWQQKKMGYSLTAEDQEYFNYYLQQGNTPGGSNRFIKHIYPDALNWNELAIRSHSGQRYSFIYCYPNARGEFPIALILDPEIADQEKVGRSDYGNVLVRLSPEQDPPFDHSYRGRYITHNPIGNQLMAHGIGIIIPIGITLENLDTLTSEDWRKAMDDLTDNQYLDAESLFLVSTKEYANTAIRVASNYPFKGLILEEPETPLFGNSMPGNTDDSMAMAALQKSYQAELEALTCPILILRNKKSSLLTLNDAVLLRPLIEWGRPVFLTMFNYPIRIPEPAKEEKGTKIPGQFAYFASTMEKLPTRLLYFVQSHGNSALHQLPETSEMTRINQRGSSQATNMMNIFDEQTRRLRQLMQQATGNSALGGDLIDDFGSDPFGEGTDDGFGGGGFEDGGDLGGGGGFENGASQP